MILGAGMDIAENGFVKEVQVAKIQWLTRIWNEMKRKTQKMSQFLKRSNDGLKDGFAVVLTAFTSPNTVKY